MPKPLLLALTALMASCTTPAVPKLAETLECTVYDAAPADVQRYCLESFTSGGWELRSESDGRIVLRQEIGPPMLDKHGKVNAESPTTMDVTFDFAAVNTATHVRARMAHLTIRPDGETIWTGEAQSGRPWRQLRQFMARLPGQLSVAWT